MSDNQIYRYRVFGLRIKSQIPISYIPLVDDSWEDYDLSVVYGHVWDEGDPVLPHTQQRLTLYWKSIAKYRIENGKTITVQPYPDMHPKHIGQHLLRNAIIAAVLQRGLLPMHGFSFAIEMGAVLCLAASGLGKSTLATRLYQMGFPILCDDVTVLKLAQQKTQAFPAYPLISLTANAAKQLNIPLHHLDSLQPFSDKYILSVSDDYQDTPLPLYAIYVIGASPNITSPWLRSVTGTNVLRVLTNYTYRVGLARSMELFDKHFEAITQLGNQYTLHRIVKPLHNASIDRVVDLLLHHLSSRE